MLFFRIGKSKLSQSWHQFKSSNGGSLLNPTVSHAKACLAQNTFQSIHNSNPNFRNTLRFFAAPIQFQKPRKEDKGPSGVRMNEGITAGVIRLVIGSGKEHSILSRSEALLRAKELSLDLVEVDARANPPVCKLMNYKKEKYEKDLKEKERLKAKAETTLRAAAPKEIRFSGKTEQKDLQMKALNITRLMEDGYRVKCTVKGTVENDVMGTLSRLCALIGEVAVVESGPTLGKSSAFLVIRHIKFGQKKGGPKVLKDLADENSGLLVAKYSPASNEESGSVINEQSFSDKSSSPASSDSAQRPRTDGFSPGPNAATSYPEVKNRFSPSKEIDRGNPGTTDRDSVRSESQFFNQRREPPRDPRFPQRTRETGEAFPDGPTFRNRGSVPNDVPMREPVSPNGARTPRPGYGQFTGSKANHYAPLEQARERRPDENNLQNRYSAANRKPDASRAVGRNRQADSGFRVDKNLAHYKLRLKIILDFNLPN